MDARTIPGIVAQQGGIVNINSGPIKKQNLGETVWDIFAQPTGEVKIPTNNNINNQYNYQIQQPNYNSNPITDYSNNQVYGQYQNMMPQYQNQYPPNTGAMPKMQMGYHY